MSATLELARTASWPIFPLGQLCDFSRGLTYSKADEVEFSGNGVLRANNITLETKRLNLDEVRYIRDEIKIPRGKKLSKGSLLVCTASGSKSHLGKVAYIDKDYDFAFGGFMGQLTPRAALNPRFFYYALTGKEYDDFIAALSDGANINNLKFSQLEAFPIPVPPLAEQERIVTILGEAFEDIATATAHAERNLHNARELFQSVLQSTFQQKGEDWVETTLGEACENLDYRRVPITKSQRKPGSVPYYGASGVVDHVEGHLFDENLLLVSEDGANLLARTYPIAFSISGKAWVNNHAHVLRFERPEAQRMIEYYLNSISLQPYVSGMAQPKLNQKALNSIPVPAPRSATQRSIVQKLDALSAETRRLEAIYERKLGALAELKQSLLQRAFSGKL